MTLGAMLSYPRPSGRASRTQLQKGVPKCHGSLFGAPNSISIWVFWAFSFVQISRLAV